VIQLFFELSAHEQAEFQDATDISTNERLAIAVTLKEKTVSLAIPKQGRGAHKEKASEIAKFVTDRVSLLHIPAVRTTATAMGIADEILTSQRRQLLRSPEYAELLEKLEALDRIAVEEVETMLGRTLSRFIPGTDSVQLRARTLSRSAGLDDIYIDDGVLTSLSTKGDGIQSLVALALTMEWTRSRSHPDKHLVVAVEEPESHLHPGAVHELRQVLHGIAESQQVIVTTHSQVLINRRDLRQNVIVGDRTARPADALDELREALGVRLSDALASAEVTVICEGSHDQDVLPAILTQLKPALEHWVGDGRVVFEAAGGGSKIYARALAARAILTQPIVVLDGDQAGLRDVERLLEDGVIEDTEVLQIARPNCASSELEDLFIMECYLDALEGAIGFKLTDRQKRVLDRGRQDAWSERLEKLLKEAGVPSASSMVMRAKAALAQAVVAASGEGCAVMRPDCNEVLGRLLQIIEGGLHKP